MKTATEIVNNSIKNHKINFQFGRDNFYIHQVEMDIELINEQIKKL